MCLIFLFINKNLDRDDNFLFEFSIILYNNDRSLNKIYYKDQLFKLIKILYHQHMNIINILN